MRTVTNNYIRMTLLAAIAFSLPIGAGSFFASQGQSPSRTLSIDLTSSPPTDQQGHGIPGARSSTNDYQLPLRLTIVRTSVNTAGDFVLDVQVTNVGAAPFELPLSRDISGVEGSVLPERRILFIDIRTDESSGHVSDVVGSAATATAIGLAHSSLRLKAGRSVNLLLRVQSQSVRKKSSSNNGKFPVHVVCNEWILQDGRFFIQAQSKPLLSENVVNLAKAASIVPQ
jgi:hypothetical protein